VIDGVTIRDSLTYLEKLSHPNAMHLPEDYHLGEFIKTINQKGFLEELRRAEHNDKIGKWLSAALDDIKVCDEMKADIRAWMGDK
jgi:hypothetical protein